jgi:hypothetical protein
MDKPIPILVVWSESKNRYALMEILDREGWKTICASTASECKKCSTTITFMSCFANVVCRTALIATS